MGLELVCKYKGDEGSTMKRRPSILLSVFLLLLLPGWARAVEAPAVPPAPGALAGPAVEEFILKNGMRFLLVQRPDRVTVAAGWVAGVGSANEAPGTTGLTHLLEHMLFKGTETIGARDRAREQGFLAEEERLAADIRAAWQRQRERFRAGEIDDPYAPETFPPALRDLLARLDALTERSRQATNPGELGRLYVEAGAQGLNALTLQDMTLFFVTLPAEKLELWFWMESDRLLHPVFRDFYTERKVVEEERRQRTESTPTGPFDEELGALFWQSHPYGWPVVGWPSDLAVLRRQDAEAHFRAFYRPANLTAALVGNVDPARAKELAERYFGRLPASPEPVPDVPTLERPSRTEKRMLATCDCRPQVEARYHTVPFGHPDSAALDVLAGLLNGRTGRLYRSLVVEEGVAWSAYARQSAMRWAGSFSFYGESKGEASPEEILAGWERELAALRREPVPESELTKVKNGLVAESFRRLEDPSALLLQLLMDQGFGDWRYLHRQAEAALGVTAEDLQRVVRRYFQPENRAVGLFERRREGAEAGEGVR